MLSCMLIHPTTREDADDRTESWKVPNFTTFDLYASYKLPIAMPVRLNLSILLTDLLYVNEAVDNSDMVVIIKMQMETQALKIDMKHKMLQFTLACQ